MKIRELLDSNNALSETASSGATSSGAVASVTNPFGIVMRRPSLFGYVPAKKTRRKRAKKSSRS